MKGLSRLSSLVAAALVAASLAAPAGARAAHPASGYVGAITVYASSYTPSDVRPVTATTLPHRALNQVAAAWEKTHPGITIKFVDFTPEFDVDYSGYFTTMRVRMLGGTAPDILSAWAGWDDGLHNDKLTLNLYPYLQQPNPYVSGNARWVDAIVSPYKTVANLRIQGPNDYEAVPLGVITTGVFYNKGLAAKLGISTPPRTMDEFIADIKLARSKGYLGFYTENGGTTDWAARAFAPAFLMGDVKKYAIAKPWESSYIPGVMDGEDFARAWKKLGYLPSKDTGLAAYYTWLKGFVSLWTPGWVSDTTGTKQLQLFSSGRLLFCWNSTGFIPQLQKAGSAVNYGTFWFPNFTQRASPLVDPSLPVMNVGGFGDVGLEINAKSAQSSSKRAAMIDFLQYVTSRQPNEQVINEVPATVPAAVGAKGDARIAQLAKTEQTRNKWQGNYPIQVMAGLTSADQNSYESEELLYLQGVVSLDKYLHDLDKLMNHSYQAQWSTWVKSKSNPTGWDTSKW